MKSNKILTNSYVVTAIAIFCCALWGSATPFIKIGYNLMLSDDTAASAILFAGIRFCFAGIIVILCYSIFRKKALLPRKENWGSIAWISIFQMVIQYILFYIGVANTTGVKATIISGSGTFSALFVACVIFRHEKLTPRKIFACIIGFLGILLINLNGLEWKLNFFGDGFVFFATFAYGVSSSLMKRFSHREDPVIISGYQFMMGGILMMVAGFLFGGSVTISNFRSVWVLGYLSLLSAVAYSLWGILLKYNPVSRVAVFSFMIPVFGVVLSYLLLAENSQVNPLMLLCSLMLIGFGILIQNDITKERK